MNKFKFCPECGTKNGLGNFCVNCGHPISLEGIKKTTSSSKVTIKSIDEEQNSDIPKLDTLKAEIFIENKIKVRDVAETDVKKEFRKNMPRRAMSSLPSDNSIFKHLEKELESHHAIDIEEE